MKDENYLCTRSVWRMSSECDDSIDQIQLSRSKLLMLSFIERSNFKMSTQ